MAYQISDIGDLVLDHSRSTKKKMLDELSCRNSVNNNNNTTNNKFILYSTNTQQTVHFLRENGNKTLQFNYCTRIGSLGNAKQNKKVFNLEFG